VFDPFKQKGRGGRTTPPNNVPYQVGLGNLGEKQLLLKEREERGSV